MLPDLVIDHLLTWMVLVPSLTALALLATEGFGGLPPVAWKIVALAAAFLDFALGIALFLDFDPTHTGFQAVDYVPWLPEYGIYYFVGIDGISLPLVLLTVFLVPLVLVASWQRIRESARSFVFFTLMLQSYLLGALGALNLFLFYVYWEVLVVPSCFIIGIWGGEARARAATKLALMTGLGSVLLLLAILTVSHIAFEQTGTWTFDLATPLWAPAAGLLEFEIATDGPWWRTQNGLFVAFALALAVRIPLVPLHTWLPGAGSESSTEGSVLLAGLLLSLGAYGFLRFALPLFPVATLEWAPLLMTLSVVGVLLGALIALVERDLKRLLTYLCIAQLGMVVLGILSMNLQGLNGSVLQMVSHGLAAAGLFFLAGMLEERRGTRRIEELGGIARPMPAFAFFFALFAFSAMGIPMLAGFVGEFLILLGSFRASPGHGVAATVGFALIACAFVWLLQRLLLGPVEDPENRKLIDLDWREKGVLLAVCIPIVWIGVHPSPLLRRIEPSVSELLQQIETRQGDAAARVPSFRIEEIR